MMPRLTPPHTIILRSPVVARITPDSPHWFAMMPTIVSRSHTSLSNDGSTCGAFLESVTPEDGTRPTAATVAALAALRINVLSRDPTQLTDRATVAARTACVTASHALPRAGCRSAIRRCAVLRRTLRRSLSQRLPSSYCLTLRLTVTVLSDPSPHIVVPSIVTAAAAKAIVAVSHIAVQFAALLCFTALSVAVPRVATSSVTTATVVVPSDPPSSCRSSRRLPPRVPPPCRVVCFGGCRHRS